jgi:hypothetical protein
LIAGRETLNVGGGANPVFVSYDGVTWASAVNSTNTFLSLLGLVASPTRAIASLSGTTTAMRTDYLSYDTTNDFAVPNIFNVTYVGLAPYVKATT